MVAKQSLGDFLKEVSNYSWDKFVEAEHDPKYSTRESIIFSLVRACVMEQIAAIKVSLDRIDGKLKTPVKVEYPKMFYIYPNATSVEGIDMGEPRGESSAIIIYSEEGTVEQKMYSEAIEGELLIPDNLDYIDEEDNDLATLSLRQTLERMVDAPRQIPDKIIEFEQQIEQHYRKRPAEVPLPPVGDRPAVKSVIAAHLLKMAQHRKIDALYEVFDQIDGKLVETIQIVGEDVLIPNYSLTAPAGAYLNEQGVLQLEATQAQELWTQKFMEGKR
jgi:hypothetical protein